MEHKDLLDASQDILAHSTPDESPMTFSKRIIDRINTSSRRVAETVSNTQITDVMSNSINKKIQEVFDSISIEFEDQLPELQSKLNHTKSQITLIHQEIESKSTQNRKRGPPDQANNLNKKQKDQSFEEPTSSYIQSEVKNAITQAIPSIIEAVAVAKEGDVTKQEVEEEKNSNI